MKFRTFCFAPFHPYALRGDRRSLSENDTCLTILKARIEREIAGLLFIPFIRAIFTTDMTSESGPLSRNN